MIMNIHAVYVFLILCTCDLTFYAFYRHLANKILNAHAPEWSGEVRNIVYSSDGKSVSVVYRVTLYGTDAEIYREATGTASVEDKGFGDPVQKAEGMAFRRACARLGLGLHLYHEDMS
uniref:DNA repair RAD52-like protein 1, mitochondrial n=1 Tax=Aegilops tauschii subsp. strangulata TaxID=200361 RepID=A0A453G2I5_AEGTS